MKGATLLFLVLFCFELVKAEPCDKSGLLKDCGCELESINKMNLELSPKLHELLKQKYFRYFNVNLQSKCPFWDDNGQCFLESCCVHECPEEQIPNIWKEISDVTAPNQNLFTPMPSDCGQSEKDFCVVETESKDGIYVDLLENVEAYTGFNGDSAKKIWSSIYNENCFLNEESPLEESCTEKKVFFKLISGMHASISAHLSSRYYDQDTKSWVFNVPLFEVLLANHPDRIENLYFLYVVMLRSITKLSDYLLNYDFGTGDSLEDKLTEDLVRQIVTYTTSCPKIFDETNLFVSQESMVLKEEYKKHFRNISMIMDCVPCEKCRLWGKIQTGGIGTALKILFSFDSDPLKKYDYHLHRKEIIALFNAFGRFSESLESLSLYKKYYFVPNPTSIPSPSPSQETPQIQSTTDNSWTAFIDSKKVVVALISVGIVILLTQKKRIKDRKKKRSLSSSN